MTEEELDRARMREALQQWSSSRVEDLALIAARLGREGWTPPILIDPDVLLIRQILHAQQRAMSPPDSGWGDMSYLKGSYDHLPAFQAALSALRAGREG